MNTELIALQQQAKQARDTFLAAVKNTQLACLHKEVAECDWEQLTWSHLRPMRVCLACGLSEEGWGCGYIVLKGEARSITRKHLYSLREGFHISEDDKGPLLRREITLRQMGKACLHAKNEKSEGENYDATLPVYFGG